MSDVVSGACDRHLCSGRVHCFFWIPGDNKAGGNVEVKGVIRTTGGAAIGDADITMNYDSSALEFVSGDNVRTERAGEIVYSGKGTGEETELSFMMTFKVLKEGQSGI